MYLLRTSVPLAWAAVVLTSSYTTTAVSALPFGKTRGSKKDETSKSGAAIAVDEFGSNIEFVHVDVSHNDESSSRRNAVVEDYFASNTESSSKNASQALQAEIHKQAAGLHDFLVSTRRALHQIPELMYEEELTSQHIQSVLQKLGISYSTGWAVNKHPDVYGGTGGHGIVADIGTGEEPCVLLRADMDALPIVEETPDTGFRSQHTGRMHACAHDGHTTMLLGAAAMLQGMQDSLNGTVRLMFQPAEEGGAGAKRMIAQGVLQQTPVVQHAFGLHMWPTLPSGVVASRPGPLLAACERFEVVLTGRGGHAAMPHLTVDPVVTAAALVMNLQTIVSRTVSPLEAGVCSITAVQAGTDAFNVIPSTVTLRGTIRALSTETLLQLRDKVQHIVETTAATHGCQVSIEYSTDYYPPTVNDPVLYETFAKPVAALVSEEGVVRDTEPTMGAEDFSFVAESIPSAFFLLGQGSGRNPPTNFGLHHPQFALDESVLPRGVELHVNLAVRALKQLGRDGAEESKPKTVRVSY